MKLSKVVLVASTYDPGRQSAELLQAKSEFSEPEYQIDLDDGIVTVLHKSSGHIGIYSAGRLSYGCTRTEPVVELVIEAPPKAPEPVKKGRK